VSLQRVPLNPPEAKSCCSNFWSSECCGKSLCIFHGHKPVLLHGVCSGNRTENIVTTFRVKGRGKAVPLQTWSGPEGSRKLRFPDFMTTQDGGKVVSLTHRPPLTSGNTPCTHFCLRLNRPQGHRATGRIMSLKNSNDSIGNRTRDLPVCSVVPWPLRHRAPPFTVKEGCNMYPQNYGTHIVRSQVCVGTKTALPISVSSCSNPFLMISLSNFN
jgi:hypothetical protein